MKGLRALLLVAALVPCASAHDALQSIDDCLARLDSVADVGYARIAARCPDLASALDKSQVAPWLRADWRQADNQLSAKGLAELRGLMVQQLTPAIARRAPPRTERVPGVLESLRHAETVHGGWWLRFKQWLRQVFTPAPEAGGDSRLRRWLASLDLSRSIGDAIAWTALALVVALAVSIVLNELRVAGLLGRRERRGPRVATKVANASQRLTLEAIEQAPLRQQPAMLLEFIATRLAAEDRLPPARALTVRELSQRARLPDEAARARLAELATVCEDVRFSDAEVRAEVLARAVSSGRGLLATLDILSRAIPAAV